MQAAEGRKLVIVDNLVIDVSEFIEKHPGGKFILEPYIGRDASFVFNRDQDLKESAYIHSQSNYARKVLQELAIARLVSTNEQTFEEESAA